MRIAIVGRRQRGHSAADRGGIAAIVVALNSAGDTVIGVHQSAGGTQLQLASKVRASRTTRATKDQGAYSAASHRVVLETLPRLLFSHQYDATT